jgi:hypothetical protein
VAWGVGFHSGNNIFFQGISFYLVNKFVQIDILMDSFILRTDSMFKVWCNSKCHETLLAHPFIQTMDSFDETQLTFSVEL